MNQNKISIARALKQKSRIAGKVRNCLDILRNDNSCRLIASCLYQIFIQIR